MSVTVGSEVRSLEAGAPAALLMLVAAGWILGIAGLLGYGPSRPGPVTIVATALLVAVVVLERVHGDQDADVEVDLEEEQFQERAARARESERERATTRAPGDPEQSATPA